MSAIDEKNDAIRARVAAAMGPMPQGLDEDERDEWVETADRLFFQFCEAEVVRSAWHVEQAEFYAEKFATKGGAK